MIIEIWNLLTCKGKSALLLSIIGFVVYALAGAGMILSVLYAMEAILDGKPIPQIYILLIIFSLLLKSGSNMFADLQKHFAGFDIVYEIRAKIIRQLKSFSLGFYTSERLGEISTVIHKDVDNMEMIVGHLWTRMCADFIVSLILLIFLGSRDLKLTLIMFIVIPGALFFLSRELEKSNKIEEETGNSLADMVSLFVEYVKGIPVLKAFFESKQFEKKLTAAVTDFGNHSKTAAGNKAKILSIYGFIIDLAYWVLVIAGIFLVAHKKTSASDFLIFVIFSREFYKPFIAMETHWMNYLKAADSFKRIKRITEARPVTNPDHPEEPKEYAITFDRVGFAYETGGFVMKNISFHIPAQTVTALVGESGSGKTTVTNLLLRFWDVDKGAIRIGNIDIRQMRYDDLLGAVSIVMQNVQLFADTIEGNIRVGKANATEEEIVAAAKKARIHDFILSLPDGYRTPIGENGVGLSGGQKQRISIARAFLKNAPILLLDEITSSVDPINEALIQEAIFDLAKNRTVLVIAHQLSTIRSADQILVFKNGTIKQSGKHEELISDPNGEYRRLWDNSFPNRETRNPEGKKQRSRK